jgi:ATP synthase protein I
MNNTGNNEQKNGLLLSSLGIHLALSVAAGTTLGYFADRWLNTGPWLLVTGFALGIIAGFTEIFRQVRKSNE